MGFSADGEGVKEIEPESKIEAFVLAVAKVAWPRIFMPMMPLPAARISRMTLTTVVGSESI